MMKAREGKENKSQDEKRLRALIEEWLDSVRKKDVDRAVSHYATNVVLFDLAPPLKSIGPQAYRKDLEEWFSTFKGPIGYDLHDLQITVGGDVALAHSINHMTGARTNGEQSDVWVRVTVGFQKIDGDWQVIHEHVSVPFYMDGSYKAAIDLKP
jgi:PhnB protein